MKTAAHQYEDKLLEFAYGELARPEADAVEAHVRGCTRCSEALSEIRGVRATMAQLPMVAAPEAGLDSLLAYAEQAAKRNAQAAPAPSFWKRFMTPLVTVMALATVGVIGLRANEAFDTNPASVVADQRLAEVEKKSREAASAPVAPATLPQAHKNAPREEQAAKANLDEVVAQDPAPVVAASPKTPRAEPALENEPSDDLAYAYNKKGAGKSGDLDNNTPGTPQSVTRRKSMPKPDTSGLVTKDSLARELDAMNTGPGSAAGGAKRDDFGNARGAYVQEKEAERSKAKSPPPPPAPAEPEQKVAKTEPNTWTPEAAREADLRKQQAQPQPQPQSQDKPSFGLGSSSPSGGLSAPVKSVAEAKKEVAAKPPPTPAYADDGLDSAYGPTPKVAAPSTAPVAAPRAVPTKKSLSIAPLSASSGRVAADEEGSAELQATDAKMLKDEAKLMDRQRAEIRGQSLEQARVDGSRGNRQAAIGNAEKVLKLGATGDERAEALRMLCDSYDALGEPERADPYCSSLVREFPSSIAARAVSQRRSASTERVSPKKPMKTKSLDSYEAPAAAPADKQPANAPAQAY